MTCLCWSSNLLVNTRLMRRNEAASQGHFKTDHSPHQNMLDLDWECLTHQKQVFANITSHHFPCHELWRLRCLCGRRVSTSCPNNKCSCHAVILWWAVRAHKQSPAPRRCMWRLLFLPWPKPHSHWEVDRELGWGILLQELPHRGILMLLMEGCEKYIKNSNLQMTSLQMTHTESLVTAAFIYTLISGLTA